MAEGFAFELVVFALMVEPLVEEVWLLGFVVGSGIVELIGEVEGVGVIIGSVEGKGVVEDSELDDCDGEGSWVVVGVVEGEGIGVGATGA